MFLKIQLIIILFYTSLLAQSFKINKIEPPNWWSGMKNSDLQLMVYGENLDKINVSSKDNRFKIKKITKPQNSKYLFVDVSLKNTPIGKYDLIFSKDRDKIKYEYAILKRELSPKQHSGFSDEDVVYLIMADRFCDGNPDNNTIDDSLDQFEPDDLNGRKGGDIEGIISKLDYLKELGITTVWVTPLLENNMWMSYHGYATTNLYRIDPRFGTNDLYKKFVSEAHSHGLKIIMDHVSNHIGVNHEWVKNLPFDDWINGTVENHLPANHNKMTFPDPHSPGESVDWTWDGWFTDYMVDLNQANEFLKKYLIQNTIWWIEYSGIDGVREDTYPYCNQYSMAEWTKAILTEYPKMNIVGEIWTGEPAILAAYQQKDKFGVHLDSHLPCVTDFALFDAFRDYLSDKRGLEGIFNTLAQDFLYYDPNNLLIFFDNHDVTRGLFIADEDIEKFKVALTILLTSRGIPQIFYGTEIGIVGDEKHGNIRSPFPGGFKDDDRNAFIKEDRKDFENDLYDYLQNLMSLRKKYKSLSSGKLLHFYPFDNLYIYFKLLGKEKIMVVVNGNSDERQIDLRQVRHILSKAKSLANLNTNVVLDYSTDLQLSVEGKKAALFQIIE